MANSKITYAIYARVSGKQQAASDKISIPEQLEQCHRWAAEQGLTRAERSEYVDPGISGEEYEGRPAFVQWIKDGQAGRYDVALVRFGDRISRTVKISSAVFHDLSRAGVQIRDLSKNTSSVIDPVEFKRIGHRANSGALIESTFTGLMAEIDQNQRIERLMTAKRRYIKDEGRYVGGRLPYGYMMKYDPAAPGKTHHIPVPDPKTYPVIQEIPRLVLERHMSDVEIADYFTRLGYQAALGGPLLGHHAHYMRSNPFYAGKLVYGRQTSTSGKRKFLDHPNLEDLIITDHPYEHPWSWETFLAMQELKNTRKKFGGRPAGSPCPLTGILKCGYCQHAMLCNRTINNENLRCNLHQNANEACQPNNWTTPYVWEAVKAELDAAFEQIQTNPENFLQSIGAITNQEERLVSLESQLTRLRRELSEDLPRRRKKVNRAWQDDDLSNELYNEQIEDLKKEQADIESQIPRLEFEIEDLKNQKAQASQLSTAFEAWQDLREQVEQAGKWFYEWPSELSRKVKFEVLQPLFRAIYIKEGPSEKRWGKRKMDMELVFEYRHYQD
jgi:DNA invertase Pin-like site-specific DNA recombinase